MLINCSQTAHSFHECIYTRMCGLLLPLLLPYAVLPRPTYHPPSPCGGGQSGFTLELCPPGDATVASCSLPTVCPHVSCSTRPLPTADEVWGNERPLGMNATARNCSETLGNARSCCWESGSWMVWPWPLTTADDRSSLCVCGWLVGRSECELVPTTHCGSRSCSALPLRPAAPGPSRLEVLVLSFQPSLTWAFFFLSVCVSDSSSTFLTNLLCCSPHLLQFDPFL